MADVDREGEVLEEKRLVTGRISETTRYIGFGLLAIFYGIVSSAEPFSRNLATSHLPALKFMAVCGFLAILLDYLQYVFGRAAVQRALTRRATSFDYDQQSLPYRARSACFKAKQGAALIGSAAFILIVLAAV